MALAQWRRITTPFALAVLSLVAAIALWVAVTDAENPDRVGVFSGAIEVRPVNIPDGLGVAAIREPSVSITVSAPEDVFDKLTVADFRAEVDLAGQRPPGADLRVQYRVVSDKDVEIVGIEPAFVNVTLEPATSKLVPVQWKLVGSPPQGFTVSTVDPNPGTVRVTGATSLVQLVASASADINLTGRRVNLQQQFNLTPQDARGADIRGVNVEPGLAEIRVGIAQQEVTLALTIVPAVVGTVADGFNLVGVSSEPPAIAVSGPLEALQAISFLTTEDIDASGLRAETTRSVRLRLPPGLAATRDSVTVRLKVAPALGETAATVVPQVSGLGENLRATLQTPSLTVRLSGELPALRALGPGSVRATLSAAGLDEGVHVLRPAVTAPEGLQVVSIDPQQVVLVIRR